MDSISQNTLSAAISSLQPDAPIYAVEIGADGTVTLILPSKRLIYTPSRREGAGGKDSTPSTPSANASSATRDDFTCIPYVGREIALALNNAGFLTFDDLVRAHDTALLDLPQIGPFALGKIRTYLKEHYL